MFPLFIFLSLGWEKVYDSLSDSERKPEDGSSSVNFAVGALEHTGGGEGGQSPVAPWKGR